VAVPRRLRTRPRASLPFGCGYKPLKELIRDVFMGGKVNSGLTVRPPDRWQNHKLFFAVVLIVAAAALFQWGNIKFRQRHGVAYRATATIRLTDNADHGKATASSNVQLPLDYAECLAEVAQQLDKPETLRQVIGELPSLGMAHSGTTDGIGGGGGAQRSAAMVEEVLSALRVSVRPLGNPAHQVAITCTSPDQAMAVPVVNALAARGSDLFRQCCRSKVRASIAAAAEQIEQSRSALAETQRNIDRFLSIVAQSAAQGERSSVGKPAEPDYRDLVENPQWAQLQAKLEQLEQQRAVLLVERTEEHPAVRHADSAIAELRRQLAAVPRWLEAPPSRQPRAASQPDDPASQPSAAPEPVLDGQRAATLEQLKQSLADAQQRAAQAELKHQQALAAAQSVPDVEVRWATGCQEMAPRVPLGRLLLGALGAGLAATIGLCLICAGLTTENAVATKAEVEARLPVPVVGVIPSQSAGTSPRAFRMRQRLAQWGQTLIGALLVLGAVATFAAS